ncbi:hypothetical protein [Prescottella equi]|uniref:hypothetical protein n=1 Tax=Rhodococcus hoagii TaxID=43767 RepID=UPI000D0ED65B|nr:hypothetical protein [Prescottella equi]AVP71270.1 hypothetical protein C7H75_24625 [Prescottella equi]
MTPAPKANVAGGGTRRLIKAAQTLARRHDYLLKWIEKQGPGPAKTSNERMQRAEAAALEEVLAYFRDTNLAPNIGFKARYRAYRHTLPRREHQPDFVPSTGHKGVLEDHQLFESVLGLSGELIYVCTCSKWSGADLAAHQLAELTDAGYVVAAIPDADNPSPALWETAYNVQDDLSRVPSKDTLRIATEIVDVYLNGQDHETVHVLGHDAAVAKWKAAAKRAAA